MALVPLDRLEISRYLGTWYQVASTPRWYEPRGAYNITAFYEQNTDGSIAVTNQLYENGKVKRISGRAEPTDQANQFKLTLNNVFLWFPARSDYVVQAVYADDNGDYRFAVVSGQKEVGRGGFYLLARTQNLTCEEQDFLLELAFGLGYDLKSLQFTPQVCGLERPLGSNNSN